MSFSHPLSRGAKIWPMTTLDNKVQNVLLVSTTLELHADHKRFKPEKVERLTDAVIQYLNEKPGNAVGFVLVQMER